MKVVKAIAITVILAAMSMGTSASAQQPTPAVTAGRAWCPDAPASPPPPGFEHHLGDWAATRKLCGARMDDRGCRNLCEFAVELWSMKKAGRLNQPNSAPSPTDQTQGPFPLPGGASGFILPAQPAPTSEVPSTSDALASILPPGPFSSFPGQELNATIDAQPPDPAADVSSMQNAQFVNDLGLYV